MAGGKVSDRKMAKATYESPKARLARVGKEAKAEAFLNRQRPLGGAAFASFLRFG